MSVVLMSKRELNRIDILARLESGRLTPGAAAALLQVSERQVYRLRRRFRDGGPAAIADRRRGSPSNNRPRIVRRAHAVALVREHYAGSARPGRRRSSKTAMICGCLARRCAAG